MEVASPLNEQWWFEAHHDLAPRRMIEFLAEDGIVLAGKRVADVGCGDGLVDLGLVQRANPASLVGYDVNPTSAELLLERARRHGVADGLPPQLSFARSEPTRLPADDGAFDVVVTWSAFEHVGDPPALLAEIRRVLAADGLLFLQLWPFYHSERGSHLWEWCPEPFHHLVEPAAESERRVRAGTDAARADLMLGEFRSLNRYTLDDLGRALRGAGLAVRKLAVQTDPVRPPEAALGHPLSALAIAGVQLLATPAHIPAAAPGPEPRGREHLRAAARELRAAGRALGRRVRARRRPAAGPPGAAGPPARPSS
jgi:SAM-dependent methyltransferase